MRRFEDLYRKPSTPPKPTARVTGRHRQPLEHAMRGSKNTAAYYAHSYPTKVPPEAIEPFIAHHTEPGDLVLDPFCGSGMTGVAARSLGRRVVLNDLSFGAVHLASNATSYCDPAVLAAASEAVLGACAPDLDSLYTSARTDGGLGRIHWTLFSQCIECPGCGHASNVWEEGTDQTRGAVSASWPCARCRYPIVRRNARLLGAVASVVCATDARGRHTRPLSEAEFAHLDAIAGEPLTDWHPTLPLGPEREMYIRSALHLQEIRDVADFWTPRNLRALARLWREILSWPDLRTRQALAFAFTNTAWHGTKMRRYNARGGQRPLTGTLYVPQLSIEVNVADVFRHKIEQLRRFYTSIPRDAPHAHVTQGSASDLRLTDRSIDYCFTDPPFGSNIFYADCAVVWESWLRGITPPELEAVVNRSLKPAAGGKTVDDYHRLMAESFAEIQRVLKPNGWATVVFQSSDAEVWAALRSAVESAGFDLANASYLDKTQQSHKGYKGRSGSEDVSSFDVVLNLHKPGRRRLRPKPPGGYEDAAELLGRHLASLPRLGVDPEADRQRTLPFLHSLLVQAHFNGTIGLEIGEYALVRRICEGRFSCDNRGRWQLAAPSGRATG